LVSFVLLGAALAGLTGCAPRRTGVAATPATPGAWRFEVTDGPAPGRLIPPVAAVPVKGIYRIPLDGLRFAQRSCAAAVEGFELRPGRRGALALVFPATLVAEGRGATAFTGFREALLRLEDSGCLPEGSAPRVARALVESLALPSRQVLELRYGVYDQTGVVTLEPGFRLKVVAPLLQPGFTKITTSVAPNSAPGALSVDVQGLAGFETSFYDVRERTGGGVEFALVSVEQNRIGVLSHPSRPSAFEPLPKRGMRCFQLLFLRRLSLADRDIALLGGANWTTLLASAHRFDTVPGAVAECGSTPGLDCIGAAAQTAINAEFGITLNGQAASVPIGSHLGDLLNGAGFKTQEQQERAIATLSVERMWHGSYHGIVMDKSNRRSFACQLLPGDRVSWSDAGAASGGAARN